MVKSTSIGALLALLCLVIYWPALHGQFIWDDIDLIRQNPLITSPLGLMKFWTTRETVDFWPLANSFFWIEWRLFGESTLGYHLVNLVLHLANVALVWKILSKLRVPFAEIVALLFAVHPMNVEAVAWIFQAKTLLSTFFVLASTAAFLRAEWTGSRLALLGSIVLFAASLLTKISTVMWPFVFLFYHLWRGRKSFHEIGLRLAPFFLLSLVFGLVNLNWYDYGTLTSADAIRDHGVFERLQLVGYTFWFYALKTFIPSPLVFVHERWDLASTEPLQWLPFLALLGGIAALWWRRPEKSRVWAGAAHFVVLFPALGIFTIYFQRYSFVAEHWHYLAMPVLLAMFVTSVAQLAPNRFMWPGAIALALVFVALGNAHARHFAGPEAIWSDTLEKNPRSFLAANNLGQIFFEAGKMQEAERLFTRSLEIKSDYRDALLNLGRVRKMQDRYEEAESLYLRAIEASPKFVSAYINLGALYGTVRKFDESKRAFEKALEIDPEAAVVHFNLAALYQSVGDQGATYRELGLANRVSGAQALKLGHDARAREFLEAAAKFLPDDPEIKRLMSELASH